MTDQLKNALVDRIKLYEAWLALAVWDPAKWNFYPNKNRRNQLQLSYKARGIVEHDRFLTGTHNE